VALQCLPHVMALGLCSLIGCRYRVEGGIALSAVLLASWYVVGTSKLASQRCWWSLRCVPWPRAWHELPLADGLLYSMGFVSATCAPRLALPGRAAPLPAGQLPARRWRAHCVVGVLFLWRLCHEQAG